MLHAQAGYDLTLKKPAPFESKTLASEKSTSTKNTVLRRFVQGTVTHYNYYFNAHQKILQVLDRARHMHKDDLTQLITFYGYSLSETATDKVELDSVVYKCTAGIVLHDLRNGWVDNLYLLMGEAFLLNRKFDSADHILEFLNYHFYVKEEGDYHIAIGTGSQARDGQISIVNPESHSIAHQAFNRPPSRNDGLIWQIRSYTEQGKYAQAAGLISLLRTDPLFPERLRPALCEQEAYWFYQQEAWDSTAVYLERALPNAASNQDEARWEYLLAQLYEMTGKPALASEWYGKATELSTDPRIDIYGRLYRALLAQGNNKQTIPQTIAALLRLADKDRFAPFRDILFLSAARLALQVPDTTQAMGFLDQSARAGHGPVRNQAFLMMSELGKAKGDYKVVARSYDSLNLADPELKDRATQLRKDKALYDQVLVSILKIEREDSLQRIAAMSETERTAFVRGVLHQLLKAQGLKEENAGFMGGAPRDSLSGNDLFGTGAPGGEWYFYNQGIRSSGSQDFNVHWGSRPNVDNWRRQSAIANSLGGLQRQTTTEESLGTKKTPEKPLVLTMEALMADIPLNPKALEASNDTVAYHLYRLGGLYKNEVGDDRAAVKALETLYGRYPTYQTESTLYDLYVCWHLLGDEVKANYYLNLLHQRYPNGKAASRMSAAPSKDPMAAEATARYKGIYDQFIAGNYDSALAEKQAADSVWGKKYWTPQLMYIQGVYYAHERQDTLAVKTLNDLQSQFPKDPVAPRAKLLVDVIRRRPMIETYLRNLKITRYKEDSLHIDTTAAVAAVKPPPPPEKTQPDLRRALVNRQDSMLRIPGDTAGLMRPGLLTTNAPTHGLHSDNYLWDPASPHVVLVVMTQVATMYANEAKNAFDRYNQAVHYQENIGIDTVNLQPGINILKLGPFKSIIEALDYQQDIRKNAPKQIVPWLSADKYRFMVISLDNLDVLRSKKNLMEYANFIDSYLKNMPATH